MAPAAETASSGTRKSSRLNDPGQDQENQLDVQEAQPSDLFGHIQPILTAPGKDLEVFKPPPPMDVRLLLTDFTTKKMEMREMDIILSLTSNTALPLLRSFHEQLAGNDGLRQEIDALLLGENHFFVDPLNMLVEKAQRAAAMTMRYKKHPPTSEASHPTAKSFLAQCILRFVNDNTAEDSFFTKTVAFFLSEEQRLAFSARIFTHYRLDIYNADGFYGELLSRPISRPMDRWLREHWVRKYRYPDPHKGLFRHLYEPSFHAQGQFIFLRAPTLTLTGIPPDPKDWPKEGERARPTVAQRDTGKIMTDDEVEAKTEELAANFHDLYVEWKTKLHAADDLTEVDVARLEKSAKLYEAEIKQGALILISDNVFIPSPEDRPLSKPIAPEEVAIRFNYLDDMDPFTDHEHRVFVDAFRSLADPKAKKKLKKNSVQVTPEMEGTGFWLYISDRLPGRTVRDIIQHYYETKNSKARGGYKKGLPKRDIKVIKITPGFCSAFDALTLNLTTDTPLNSLDYHLVASQDRMQSCALVQKERELEKIKETNVMLREVRSHVVRLQAERDAFETKLVAEQSQSREAQRNSVETQRELAQKNAEIVRLEGLLKMAGDDVIHAAQVNRRNVIEAADANRKNEIALGIALQYPPEGYRREEDFAGNLAKEGAEDPGMDTE